MRKIARLVGFLLCASGAVANAQITPGPVGPPTPWVGAPITPSNSASPGDSVLVIRNGNPVSVPVATVASGSVPAATSTTPGITTVGASSGASAAPLSGGLVPCANLPVDGSTTNCTAGKITAVGGGGGGSYSLPTASTTTLGGVKADPSGSTVVNSGTGVLTVPSATTSTPGIATLGASGGAAAYTDSRITGAVQSTAVGAASGIASLNSATQVPCAQVPVDGSTITCNGSGKIVSSGGGGSYSLPTASTSTLGGVKADPSGSFNVNSGTGVATVPAASSTTAGLTTVGATSGASAAPLSGGLIPSANLPAATTGALGAVRPDGSTITVNSSGVITSTGGYSLPQASTSVLGGVKVDGTSVTINAGTGVISAPGSGGSVSGSTSFSTTTNTTITPARSLSSRAQDIFNVRDFGAAGVFANPILLSSYAPSCVASFSAFTACYPWASNSIYGLTFPLTIPSGDSATGTDVNLLLTAQGTYNSTANIALWQVLSNAFAIPVTGMSITSPSSGTGANCLSSGTTVAAVGADPSGQFSAAAYGGAYTYGHIKLSQAVAATCPAGTVLTFTLSPAQLGSLTQDWLGIQNAAAEADASTNTNYQYSGATVYIPDGFYTVNHPIYWYQYPTNTPSTNFRGDNWYDTEIAVNNTLLSPVGNAVFTGYMASGSTTLNISNVTSGTIAVGQTIVYPGGGGLQAGDTIISGSGSTWTLAIAASSAIGSIGSPVTFNTGFANPLLPYGSCVFEPNDRSVNPAGATSFTEMSAQVVNNTGANPYGTIPAPYSGFCAAETGKYQRVAAKNGFYAGFEFNAASVKYENIASSFNGYGVYAGKYATANGAFFIKNSDMGPNFIADFGVACTNQLDSDGFDTIHAFGGGFAFSQETCASNVTTPSNALITNSSFKDFFPECIADAFIYSPNAAVTGNIFIGGYQLNAGQTYCTGYHQPGIVANAPIQVSNFSYNTMIGTQWGTSFNSSIYPGNASANSTTPSIIRASTITNNTWRDDGSIISAGSASFPFLFMPSGNSQSNKFEVGVDGANANRSGRGYFMNIYGGNIAAAGDPLGYYLGSSGGNSLGPVLEYAWGETYAGVAGTTALSGQIAPVYVEYSGQWTVPSNAGPIAGGQPVFPAPGGFYPSVGTPSDVGTESFGIGYGAQYGNTGAGGVMSTNRSTPSNTTGATAIAGASFAGYATSGSTNLTITSGTPVVNMAVAGGAGAAGIVPGTTITAFSGGVATLSIPTIAAVGSSGSPVSLTGGYLIVAANTDFTTTPNSGAAVLTGNVPVGGGVRVCNDGANALTLYGPPGEPFATNPSLAAGACNDYRRLSATAWR